MLSFIIDNWSTILTIFNSIGLLLHTYLTKSTVTTGGSNG